MIPFNKPFLTGKETKYIEHAVSLGKISGNGYYTQKCQAFFEQKYSFKKALLTTSCTDALEMAAMLADIQPGDEVIMPSFTFVSTAIAFIRQGAKIVFADSYSNNPNIDADQIESLITARTKAIVPVHYAGIACDMDKIMSLAAQYNLIVIEDAAQAIDSYYVSGDGTKRPLGSIGHMAAFSFHETKNIISGEGGLLTVNDERFTERAEIIWEKGTNRSQFFRGEVDKYGWVDVGSSFLPSEVVAAFLWAQLETLTKIQEKRKSLWGRYHLSLSLIKDDLQIELPVIPYYATNNGHMFFVVFKNIQARTEAIKKLKKKNILSVFHYISLHSSSYYKDKHDGRVLDHSDRFTDCLLRLPMYYELPESVISDITQILKA
jgi:dTDP-4-amino-4,6-dideoxygalactose transaminase